MKLKGLFSHTDSQHRYIQEVIKLNGLSPEQKEVQRYQDCYHGRLFEPENPYDKKRMQPWGTRWDALGRPVPQKYWRPLYQSALPKEIVGTHESMLFGEDAFPEIVVKINDPAAFPGLAFSADPDAGIDADTARQLAADQAAQALVNELMISARVQDRIEAAAREAFIQGCVPVLVSAFGGQFDAEVLDSKFTEVLREDPARPKTITRLVEQYVISRQRKSGIDVWDDYLYRREVDQTHWREWEKKLDKNDELPRLTDADLKEDFEHNLGFCPVFEVYTPDRCSIFADEITDNIKGFITLDNDLKASERRQLDPQPYVLLDPDDETADLEPEPINEPGQTSVMLQPGTIWPVRGKSIGTLSTDGQHATTLEDKTQMRAEILRSCFIIEVPEKNQQSGTAISLRLAPMKTYVSKLRRSMGRDGLVSFIQMLIAMCQRMQAMGQYIDLPPEIQIPAEMPGLRFRITLDWGSIIPPDEQEKSLALQNAVALHTAKLGSRQRAMGYVAGLFGIEDVQAEMELIEAEQAQEAELLIAAQDKIYGGFNGQNTDL